jgi:hypothetical protein
MQNRRTGKKGRASSREKWITNTSIWQQAYNLAGSSQNIDIFSFKPNTTSESADVQANVAAGLPSTDRYKVSGWLDVLIGVGPSNTPAGTSQAELGSVACGLYKTVWDDATSGWATQSSLVNSDVNRGNWLYLNAKGYNFVYDSLAPTILMGTSAPLPQFRINIPPTVIEQGDALFLHVSTWLSVVGRSSTFAAMILNGRLRVNQIT